MKQINNAKLTQIGSVSNRGYVEGRGDEGNVRAVVGIDRKVRAGAHLAPEPGIGRTLALKWPYLGHFPCAARAMRRKLRRLTGRVTVTSRDCSAMRGLSAAGREYPAISHCKFLQ